MENLSLYLALIGIVVGSLLMGAGLYSLTQMAKYKKHMCAKAKWEAERRQVIIHPSVLERMGMTVEDARVHAAKPGAIWLAEPNEIVFV